jgi:hypothetical protein
MFIHFIGHVSKKAQGTGRKAQGELPVFPYALCHAPCAG